MANKVTIDIRGEQSVLALLAQLPVLVVSSGGPLDRAVQKAANIVAARARQIAPDGQKSGSRKKQSKSARAKWPATLRKQIRSKLIKYPTATWSVIGAKSPEGNAAHFAQEKPRRLVLWGKATAVKKYRIERNWITRAFDETKQQQLTAMEQSLKADIDANMRAR